VPAGAETIVRKGERLARWRVNGKTRTAPLTTGRDGSERIVTEAATFTAKYRDGAGVVREVATGCRDETAAPRRVGRIRWRRARGTWHNITLCLSILPIPSHLSELNSAANNVE
jgi:hypothetical protein